MPCRTVRFLCWDEKRWHAVGMSRIHIYTKIDENLKLKEKWWWIRLDMQKEKIGWKFNERRYNVSSIENDWDEREKRTNNNNNQANKYTRIEEQMNGDRPWKWYVGMVRVWMCKCDWIWEMARLKLLANDVGLYELYVENCSFGRSVEKVSHLTARRWTLERWAKINCRRHLLIHFRMKLQIHNARLIKKNYISRIYV